jgi:diguanylate cyclase (GGDEF)-like protein
LRRKQHTVLDVWLMVVMCVWLSDIALAAILNTGRYDLGWYVGRIYGLLAASFLLIVLLLENGRQYARLVNMSVELSAANKTLGLLSRQDGLTELANRRSFDEYLAEQIALAGRHNRPLALVLCDVDHFKAYNDLYGHQLGDACLTRVAAALQSCCRRPADMAARYGGEEFAIILPDTDLAGAMQVAEAARTAVIGMKILHGNSTTGQHVSISGGVAVWPTEIGATAQQLIAAADQALYQAKNLGRNRVACVEPTPH